MSGAAIEDFLTRGPESVLVALQRTQERQQQVQLASLNTSVQAVANAVIAGEPKVTVIGNPRATRVIVELYDYNRGCCKAFHTYAMTPLMNRDTNLRFHVVLTPILGSGSQHMAELSVAAHLQGKFAAAHKYLIEHRASNAKEADALIPGLSEAAGLDRAAFLKALDDSRAKAIVTHNAELARKTGVSGTPSL